MVDASKKIKEVTKLFRAVKLQIHQDSANFF